MRSYSDEQLTSAVAESTSWRGVLRNLGLKATSAGASRSVQKHAHRLGLDSTHFRGSRRWTDGQLRAAVAEACTWNEVLDLLGLASFSSTSTIRGHAMRLGLDAEHLNHAIRQAPPPSRPPRKQNLRRAGALMAASWFELCGDEVSWPLEPCRYDLLVWRESVAQRVQVKTTTVRDGSTWAVQLRRTGSEHRIYDPDDLDQFFIVDGDLSYYLIPIAAVAGRRGIRLSAYEAFRLPPLALVD